MSHYPFRHPWPIYFPWVFLILFLTLHSHRFLLTPLGFPDPITLSLILGAHGLAINPLLSLLTLLRTCCGPFSLFYITYFPWVCHFSLFGLLQAHLLPQGPFIYFMSLRSLFLLLGLNGFSIYSLTLFCSCCQASSFYWASQNGHQQEVLCLLLFQSSTGEQSYSLSTSGTKLQPKLQRVVYERV